MTSRTRFLTRSTALVLTLAALAAGCGDDGGDDTTATTQGGATAQTTDQDGGATLDGAALFESNCGSCHTLAAADTPGQIGPNLDDLRPDEARVLAAIRSGPGAMPPNLLEGAEAEAVAQYVAQNAGR